MRKLLTAVLIFTASNSPSFSTEFANIFGSDEVQATSREASARALHALEQFFAGLRLREVQESSGRNQFKDASNLLLASREEMNTLLELEGFPDRELTPDERGFLSSEASRHGLLKPAAEADTNKELFQEFASLTGVMAERMGALADGATDPTGTPSASPPFAIAAEEIQAYLALANIVTRFNRQGRL